MNIYKTHYIHNNVFRKKDDSIYPYSTRVYCGNFKTEQYQTETIKNVTCSKCLDKIKKYNIK